MKVRKNNRQQLLANYTRCYSLTTRRNVSSNLWQAKQQQKLSALFIPKYAIPESQVPTAVLTSMTWVWHNYEKVTSLLKVVKKLIHQFRGLQGSQCSWQLTPTIATSHLWPVLHQLYAAPDWMNKAHCKDQYDYHTGLAIDVEQ